MLASAASRLLPLLLGSLLAVTSLPELFQKAKEQFKLGSYEKALATLDVLETESRREGFEKDRHALEPGLLFYRGASLAALGRADEARAAFQGFLAFQPNAHLDPALYPKAVVTALEDARKSLAGPRGSPEEGGALALAYRAFARPQAAPAETPGEDWAGGPVRWLLTAEERRDFERASDAVSRSEFVTSFWKARDPKPETPDNEYREEFEKRVAFADGRFTQDEVRGSLTDRGMVFILLGPPSYSGRRPLMTGDDVADSSGLSRYGRAEVASAARPGGSSTDRMARIAKVTGPGTKILDASSNWIEAWHYLRGTLPAAVPFQEVKFDFVTKQGYGKNVLQRETDALNTLERAKKTVDGRR
jgi:GWxTD domain-containing protein